MKPLLSALENRLSNIFHVQERLSLALNETYHCFDFVWHCNYVMCKKVWIFQVREPFIIVCDWHNTITYKDE